MYLGSFFPYYVPDSFIYFNALCQWAMAYNKLTDKCCSL